MGLGGSGGRETPEGGENICIQVWWKLTQHYKAIILKKKKSHDKCLFLNPKLRIQRGQYNACKLRFMINLKNEIIFLKLVLVMRPFYKVSK